MPFRSTDLVVVPSHREVAFCMRCAHMRRHDSDCLDPGAASRTETYWGDAAVRRPRRDSRNMTGSCDGYTPSWWTRLLRVIGRRGPMLIEIEQPSEPARVEPTIRVRTGMKTGKRTF